MILCVLKGKMCITLRIAPFSGRTVRWIVIKSGVGDPHLAVLEHRLEELALAIFDENRSCSGVSSLRRAQTDRARSGVNAA